MPAYHPPCTLTPAIVSLVARIAEAVGQLSVRLETARDLRLRRINRIRTIHGSLAIEGNTLSEKQITAILDGKMVIAPPREIQEVRNAIAAYDQLASWQPARDADLLAAHGTLMLGLVDDAGAWRRGGVGVMAGDRVIHMAPQADRVPQLMGDLLQWLSATDAHPLIASSIFHYEFEFIHPFSDGNGRMGRLWQTLILTGWNPLFTDIPVESLVYEHQAAYYQAIGESTRQADAAPFVEFMLSRILEAVSRRHAPSRTTSHPPSRTSVACHSRRHGARGPARCTGVTGSQIVPRALSQASAGSWPDRDDHPRQAQQPPAAIPPDGQGPPVAAPAQGTLTMAFLSEAQLETALLAQLAALGFGCASDDLIGPDGKQPERSAYDEVVLKARLAAAVARLNPALPPEAQADAMRRLTQSELPNLLEENRRIHRLLTEGADVEFYGDDGVLTAGKVRLIDFERPANNDWLAVQQFTVMAGQAKRRPDVVVFVNGLPLAVIELKAPGGENATLAGAFNQLQTYKQQIPALFRCNALLVTSDGLSARVGSLSADPERFMPWRTTDGAAISPKGMPEMATLIEGVFEPGRFLDLLRHFTVFGETGGGLIKIIAGYHQFHAVKKAVISTLRASKSDWQAEDPAAYGLPSVTEQPPGDHKAGVIWHTQGSGKSLLMAFYAGLLVFDPRMANPTLVVLTDRNDLDDQLFATFSQCRDLIRQTPVQAQDREHLRTLLNRASGGVIFTTLQKFSPASDETGFPMLTDRANVVVIADEAHRSQYGFKAKVASKTGEIAYGFAKYLRDALPNASFIGFTGTPIEATDVNTPAVFGHYIDIYDISRAVEDGATVPIYYESRLARIELDEAEKPRIDAEIEALLEDEDEPSAERTKQKWSTVEALVGSDKRLALVAADLVQHFEDRVAALDGKAMVVCMSRRICVALL